MKGETEFRIVEFRRVHRGILIFCIAGLHICRVSACAVNPRDRVRRTATSVNYIGKFERGFLISLITVKKAPSGRSETGSQSHMYLREFQIYGVTETLKLSFKSHLLVFDVTFKIYGNETSQTTQ